jgi:hypothetical protein
MIHPVSGSARRSSGRGNALRIAMLLLVTAMSTTHTRGEPAQFESRTMMGPLNFSCGKWTNTPKRGAEHEVLKTWILGYPSGVNVEGGSTDFLQGRECPSSKFLRQRAGQMKGGSGSFG